MNDWRSAVLPAHDGYDWTIFRFGRKHVCMSAGHALERIGKWLPADPTLVAAPGMAQFVPPIAIAEFRTKLHKGVANYWRMLSISLAIAALLFLIPRAYPMAVSVGAFALIFAIDYRLIIRSPTVLLERALFFYWLHDSARARSGLVLWAVLASCAAIAQLVSLSKLGSLEAVFDTYGLMYPAARAGEWWRLLTGPFVHYSVLHFMTNAALLVLGGWLAYALRPIATVVAFVAGCWLSAWCQMMFGGQVFDNFGGMSGGVFAVFSLLAVGGFLDRRLLPAGLAVFFGGVMVFSGMTAELLSETAATVAHLAGAATGAVTAFIAHQAGSRGRRSRASRAGARP